MKKWKHVRKLLQGKRQLLVICAGLLVVIVGVLVYVATAMPWRSTAKSESPQHVTTAGTQKKQASQQVTSQVNEPSTQPATTDTKSSSGVTATPASSGSTTQQSTPAPTPTPQPFAVSYVTLSQANLVCSSDGSYVIAQIGDVIVGLASASGGAISYGFEVSGDIADTWSGYRQSGSVASGTWSTTFNQMYWGSTNDPHMAYTEVIPWGHEAGAVRAVVYSPSTAYSPWFNVPAQAVGQSC